MTIANLTILFLEGAPEAAGWLTTAGLATLVLVGAIGLGSALRRTSAARRHLILTAGLLAAGLLPLAVAAMPWRVPLIPQVPTAQSAAAGARLPEAEPPTAPPEAQRGVTHAPARALVPGLDAPGVGPVAPSADGTARTRTEESRRVLDEREGDLEHGVAGGVAGEDTEAVGRVVPHAAPGGSRPLRILWGLWLLGSVGVLGRIVWGTLRVHRIRGRARAVDSGDLDRLLSRLRDRFGIERPVRILESEDVDVPMALGLWRPAIVLPSGATARWTPRRLEAVLAHELGHIRRLDLLSHLANRLSCAVHWYNPLAWLVSRRARREGERACDDLALMSGTRPSAYARILLEMTGAATRASGPGAVAAAGLPMARPGDLEGRILAILEDRMDRRPATTRSVLTAMLPALVGVLLLSAATAAPGQSVTTAAEEASAAEARAHAGREAAAGATVAPESGAVPEAVRERETSRARSALSDGRPGSSRSLLLETLTQLLEDPEPSVRAAAAASLGNRRVKKAVPALIAALEDPVAAVRKRAAGALGRIEDAAAVPSLSARLLEDRDVRVRRAAAWALGEMENGAAVEALETALAADLPPKLRAKVVQALGESEQAAAAAILEGLLSEAEPGLRRRALEALVENGTPRASEALVTAMRSPDPDLRREAAEALGRRR